MQLSKRTFSGILVIALFLGSGCGLFGGNDDPQVDEVIVVGTQVPSDFRTTQTFSLTAIPLDERGEAILSDRVEADVSIQEPVRIATSVRNKTPNEPSGDPLAVALDIDASGSMAGTDPTNARLAGAKTFVEVLVRGGAAFETSVFEYSGSGARLLQNFTSDVDSLNRAIDRIGSGGSTPTYTSLLMVLDHMEAEKPAPGFDRSVVLLSDGQPGDEELRDQTCSRALDAAVPIYAIGLGPASDLDGNNLAAVTEMRAIAECTGAAYAGIDPGQVDSSTADIFNNIGLATSKGSIEFEVRLEGEGADNLAQGLIVRGVIMLESGGESASATFAFRVP